MSPLYTLPRIRAKLAHSFRAKLFAFSATVCALALAIATIAFLANSYLREEKQVLEVAEAKAEIVIQSAASALVFQDTKFANQLLEGLSKVNDVEAAGFYAEDGEIFASYRHPDIQVTFPQRISSSGVKFNDDSLELVREIRLHDTTVGYFYYRQKVEGLSRWVARYALIAAGVFIFAFALVMVLAARFDQVITAPISELSKAAAKVQENEDYSVRAKRFSDDELGRLTEIFNAMLSRIQESREQLLHAKEAAEAGIRSKSEFLAVMSHEIRTPMNAIMGFSELIRNSPDSPDTLDFINRIHLSGKHLLNLINDILDYSSWSSGRIALANEQFSPEALIRSVVENISPQAKLKRLKLALFIDDNLPKHVIGDPIRLRQILDNLCVNAVKFTHAGEIRLYAEALPASTPTEWILQFIVSDTGIGIPPHELESIFEPFKQVDSSLARSFEGTGLGLALCRKFSEAMGGKITCQSQVGQGSRFTFTARFEIARFRQAQIPAAPDPLAVRSAASKRLKLLCAEDDPSNQIVLRNQLERLGIESDFVWNGRQAIEALRSETFDAVIMDVRMPELDGLEATRLIRSGDAGEAAQLTRIIGLTAHTISSSIDACLKAGMDACLKKPASLQELQKALQEMER